MMLADFQLPDQSSMIFIGALVVGLAGLMNLIRTAIGLRQDLRDRPTGAEALATAQGSFATKEDLDALAVKIETNRLEAKTDTKEVYERVEEVRTELDSKITDLGKEIGRKIENIPHSITALLRNTGAIKPHDH